MNAAAAAATAAEVVVVAATQKQQRENLIQRLTFQKQTHLLDRIKRFRNNLTRSALSKSIFLK